MPRREVEDRFLTALKAQDFDQNDGSADAYLVLFGTDDTIMATYPVPRIDNEKKERLKAQRRKARKLRKNTPANPPSKQRQEADRIEKNNHRDRMNDQRERYTKTVITALNQSGAKTVTIGNGPPALDRILERLAKKRNLDIVHVIDDDENGMIEEQTARLMTIDLLARVLRQHEQAGHPNDHLCFGCVYEAMREATECIEQYGIASRSGRFELSFDVYDTFYRAIHLALWEILGFEFPPKREDAWAIKPLIEQIIEGGRHREFGATAETVDRFKDSRIDAATTLH